jgi:CRISPR-associated endoribonuclease Cas6
MPRKVSIDARPTDDFHVENSDGYALYSSLLARMRDADEEASARVHDSGFSSVSVSGLSGDFRRSERDYHKRVVRSETYEFGVGVTDPEEDAVFEALVKPLVLGDGMLEVGDGTLTVEEFRSDERGFDALVDEADSYDDPSLRFSFETPTCIKYGGSDVTTMFPHRTAVFSSLLGKWNSVVPDALEFDLKRDEVGTNVIEKPEMRSLYTHSVMVNRVQNNGEPQPIFRQGFTGECTYEFVGGAPEDVKNAVTALALFGEYSGVGSAVSRGCGSVNVEVRE